MYVGEFIVSVYDEAPPICVHVTPSTDFSFRYVVPVRVTRSQYGATSPRSGTLAVPPPVVERLWDLMPDAGVTSAMVWMLSSRRVERNMTPALAPLSVFVCEATRAVSRPSPESVRQTNWKSSAVDEMSEPAPLTV